MKYLIVLAVVMMSCGAIEPVKCTEDDDSFMKDIQCHCVYACHVNSEKILVTGDGFCNPECEKSSEEEL